MNRFSWPSPLVAVTLPLAFFGAVVVSYKLAGAVGGVSPLWFPVAVTLTALIRNPARTWPILLLLVAVADIAANLVMGMGIWDTLPHGGMNALGPGIVAEGLRRLSEKRPWYASARWILSFILLAAVSAAVLATLGATLRWMFVGWPFSRVWPEWFTSNALGFWIGTPFLLSWTEPALRRRISLWGLCETSLLAGLVAAMSYLAFTSSLPLLFLVFPFLAFTTLRGGLLGATAGVSAMAGVALWSIAYKVGPIATAPDTSLFERNLILRAYFLTGLLSTMPVAIFLSLREALTDRLRQQDAISSAALDNMVQGLCMFDERRRLITFNRRYAELYPLSGSAPAAGTPLIDLAERQLAAGNYWGDPEEFVSDCLREAEALSPHREVELRDGRIVDIHRTPLAAGGWVETHEDVTERRRAGQRIAHLATHDPLTDLPNRAFFNDQLQRVLDVAERGPGFALHCLDLDRFKAVNDTLGHGAGDELLKQVADRLRGIVRKSDLVARLGGDEFVIIQFPLEDSKKAKALAARVVEALGEPYQIFDQEAVIGASVGIALAPSDAGEAADLLQKSDLALYRAKADGRNTSCFFEPGMDSLLHRRRVIETELRAAVQYGQFQLYYQPIMNVETGAITAMEALLRWQHPTRGIVEPAEFISIAEESGLIIPIGEWVLRHACHEAAGWPEDIKLSVNLSAVQFKNRNLPDLVINATRAAHLPPGRLEVEITESLLLQNSDEVLGMLERLHDAGVSIAMDDFGTGYSSLNYLRSFPFDRIKIDRSFVRDVATKEDSLAIVHATAELSGKLGMRTTAEGVETAEQLAILRAEGCTEIQGFYVSRPVPLDKVPELLARYPRRPIRLVQNAG